MMSEFACQRVSLNFVLLALLLCLVIYIHHVFGCVKEASERGENVGADIIWSQCQVSFT